MNADPWIPERRSLPWNKEVKTSHTEEARAMGEGVPGCEDSENECVEA